MVIPKNLMYSKSHEWIKFEDDGTATIGLDDYAQNALGDLVFLDSPVEGDEVTVGEPFTNIESVKAVAPVYCYVTGVIIEVNEEVVDNPASINEDPYGSWIIKVGSISDKGDLMDADAYEKFCAEV